MGSRRLTQLRLKWCQEYALKPNAKAAAVAAGYSQSSAYQRGYENSRCPDCMVEVERLRALEDRKFLIRKSEVVRELATIAMADIGDVLEWGLAPVVDDGGLPVSMPNGNPVTGPVVIPVNSRIIPPALRRAIGEVTVSSSGIFRIKMHDRMKALEMLACILGLFNKSNEKRNTDADSIAALIEAVQGAPLTPTTGRF